jgi:hypothetical protein
MRREPNDAKRRRRGALVLLGLSVLVPCVAVT